MCGKRCGAAEIQPRSRGPPTSFSAPRAPERSRAQIEKHHHDNHRSHKGSVIRAVSKTCTCAPDCWTKDKHRQEEEHARDFKPQGAADTAKRSQKPAHTAPKAATRGCSGAAAGGGIRSRLTGLCTTGGWSRRGLRRAAQALACHTTSHTQPNAKHPSDGLRLHFDMMLSAVVGNLLCTDSGPSQLPPPRYGSKVEQSHAAPAHASRRPTSWRYS